MSTLIYIKLQMNFSWLTTIIIIQLTTISNIQLGPNISKKYLALNCITSNQKLIFKLTNRTFFSGSCWDSPCEKGLKHKKNIFNNMKEDLLFNLQFLCSIPYLHNLKNKDYF